MADTDPLSSALEEIRERNARRTFAADLRATADDVPRLLAALEAVLILLREARGCCYNGTTTPGAWENFDPAAVRGTILANLTGEAGDEH